LLDIWQQQMEIQGDEKGFGQIFREIEIRV
jgi:hypothetical protein